MSLGLHPECQRRLIATAAAVMGTAKVKNGNTLDLDSCIGFGLLDSVLPNSGDIRDRLAYYFGEYSVAFFVFRTLESELNRTFEYRPDPESIELKYLAGYDDTLAAARRIIAVLESLPWHYSVTINLANDLGGLFRKTKNEYYLNDSTKVIITDELKKHFPPLKFLTQSLRGDDPWGLGSAHFQVNIDGYIAGDLLTPTMERAVSLFKSFLGLGIAVRLYKIDNAKNRSLHFLSRFGVHKRLSSSWEFTREHMLDINLGETYEHLTLDDLEGKLKSDEQKIEWIMAKLTEIRTAFGHTERAEKLMLASEWFLESCGRAHRLFSFVQTAVVLEILLGEKSRSDVVGLGELLGNRCAYLIAESHKEREFILKTFRKFYHVRSQIVHHGKSHLDSQENDLLLSVRAICARVIRKELELLGRDEIP